MVLSKKVIQSRDMHKLFPVLNLMVNKRQNYDKLYLIWTYNDVATKLCSVIVGLFVLSVKADTIRLRKTQIITIFRGLLNGQFLADETETFTLHIYDPWLQAKWMNNTSRQFH